ncbi:MAG: hypothetical protein KAV87_67990 [Desulfobacteraceae bacterium]|nr:hypothetical protein [Desulfobacteraceae bacterium]
MKDQAGKIIEILNKTESDIQKVIIEAAQAGDYRSVDMARAAAVNIKNIRTQISNPASKAEIRPAKSVARIEKKASTKKRKKSDYPKFKVKNETLIRIGWSRKQRREYTHKAPRFVFEQTVKAMTALSQSGAGPFLAENIIEQANSNESEAIPSYQIYVIIGLLKQTNCIKQVGRDGYIIPQDLVKKTEEKWVELSNRRK